MKIQKSLKSQCQDEEKKIYFRFASVIFLAIVLILFPVCRNRNKERGILEVSGIIEAVETDIKSQIKGEIKQIFAREGQFIQKGDLLCLHEKRTHCCGQESIGKR